MNTSRTLSRTLSRKLTGLFRVPSLFTTKVISWKEGVVSGHEVQWSLECDFDMLAGAAKVAAGRNTYEAKHLLTGMEYHVRVRALNDSGPSAWIQGRFKT